MYIILGGTGHVGSAVAKELLTSNKEVIIITHDENKVNDIEAMGAKAEVADITDSNRLNEIFKMGKRLFLLNPPAPPSTNTPNVERDSMQSIIAALEDSGLEKIVAESSYGAQPGKDLGDLGVLYEMEEVLKDIHIPTSIQRAAYYYSNWDSSLETAHKEGKLYSMYPPDFKLPMVAPEDLGKFAAKLLMEPVEETGLYYRTGPRDYSPNDVAAAFAEALGKPVEAVQVPEDKWESTLEGQGFSKKAANSMVNMTKVTLEQVQESAPENPERGSFTLERYIDELVQKSSMKKS